MKQTGYVIENTDNKKQISRFDYEGNRIVVIKVEAFDIDNELEFIADALNSKLHHDSYLMDACHQSMMLLRDKKS